MGGNIKKTNKDDGRMLEATDISGMKVSNIFNDPSSKQQIPVSEEPSSLHQNVIKTFNKQMSKTQDKIDENVRLAKLIDSS